MEYRLPACPSCGRPVTGHPDHSKAKELADIGHLKGCCSLHGLVEISLADQRGLAERARSLAESVMATTLRYKAIIKY